MELRPLALWGRLRRTDRNAAGSWRCRPRPKPNDRKRSIRRPLLHKAWVVQTSIRCDEHQAVEPIRDSITGSAADAAMGLIGTDCIVDTTVGIGPVKEAA